MVLSFSLWLAIHVHSIHPLDSLVFIAYRNLKYHVRGFERKPLEWHKLFISQDKITTYGK